MEKIDVFDYIETACCVLEQNTAGFAHAADKLTEYLQNTFGNIDATIGISSRIKTRDSLKEKILRNTLYKECDAQELVFKMHDIIGVRLECRFFKDERLLYNRIREIFSVDVGDGFFSPVGKKAIRLKLDAPQPEKQKNGFDIYRIDGAVTYGAGDYNFELQIKSLVNTFWSEIEHKLIYKNFRYNSSDSLMRELLNSIHESLSGVDHQLNLIFDRLNDNSLINQQSQLVSLLSLGLNEVYSSIVKAKTGIDVSISDYSQAIVIYILSGSSYRRDAKGVTIKNRIREGLNAPIDEEDTNFTGLLMSLMEWMRSVDYGTIAIGEKISFPLPQGIDSEVGKVFYDNINADFYLNTFFHIFFSLERGDDQEDFVSYINYYTGRILAGKTQEQIYRTLARLYEVPAHKLPLEKTVTMLESIR